MLRLLLGVLASVVVVPLESTGDGSTVCGYGLWGGWRESALECADLAEVEFAEELSLPISTAVVGEKLYSYLGATDRFEANDVPYGAGDAGESVYGLNALLRPVGLGMSCVAVAMLLCQTLQLEVLRRSCARSSSRLPCRGVQ